MGLRKTVVGPPYNLEAFATNAHASSACGRAFGNTTMKVLYLTPP